MFIFQKLVTGAIKSETLPEFKEMFFIHNDL